MARIRMVYEENDEDHCEPSRMVIKFDNGEFDWNASLYVVYFDAPFEQSMLSDFEDDMLTVAVDQCELTRDPVYMDRFNIHIPLLIQRLEKMRAAGEIHNDFDFQEIQQFMIFVGDILSVMQMDIRPFYDWRLP